MRLRDRRDAGHRLGAQVQKLGLAQPLVLVPPDGSSILARGVARVLDAPVDVFATRSLQIPPWEHLSLGAVTEAGCAFLDEAACAETELSVPDLERLATDHAAELARHARRLRGHRPPLRVRDRDTVLVRDCLEPVTDTRLAVRALHALGAKRVVVAAPTGRPESVDALARERCEVACLLVTEHARLVARAYDEPPEARTVEIVAGDGVVVADLAMPPRPRAIVLQVQGAGAARAAPHNHVIGQALRRRGFATVVADLVAPDEMVFRPHERAAATYVALLARRMAGLAEWAKRESPARGLPVGILAHGTAAAAAVALAATVPGLVDAIVTHAGRPELASALFHRVACPTLFLVDGQEPRLAMSHALLERLRCVRALSCVQDGAHDEAARAAAVWFERLAETRDAQRA